MYEMGSATTRQLCTKLTTILDQSEKKKTERKLRYKTLVAIPGSRYSQFACENVTLTLFHSIFPHVTLEALPQLSKDKCPYASVWYSPMQMLGELLDQFRIVLLQVEPKPNSRTPRQS